MVEAYGVFRPAGGDEGIFGGEAAVTSEEVVRGGGADGIGVAFDVHFEVAGAGGGYLLNGGLRLGGEGVGGEGEVKGVGLVEF